MFISWTCEEIDIRSLVRHHLDQPALPIVWWNVYSGPYWCSQRCKIDRSLVKW
jgi:hypothetical protein